jgi:hypothetical protein
MDVFGKGRVASVIKSAGLEMLRARIGEIKGDSDTEAGLMSALTALPVTLNPSAFQDIIQSASDITTAQEVTSFLPVCRACITTRNADKAIVIHLKAGKCRVAPEM